METWVLYSWCLGGGIIWKNLDFLIGNYVLYVSPVFWIIEQLWKIDSFTIEKSFILFKILSGAMNVLIL